MLIKINQGDLIKGINIVIKAISSRTTLPILECIVIKTIDNSIRLLANDMELGIETVINGEIIESGGIALKSKIFFDIIRGFPNDLVEINTDNNYKAIIKCGKKTSTIDGQSIDEFPILPNIEIINKIEISQYTLKEMIKQTIFSVSVNENMKVMTGELLEVNNNYLRMIALDGHRISIRKVLLKGEHENIKAVIPSKTLNEISKILSGEVDDTVVIYFSKKHIVFEFNNTTVNSRLIDGEFYNVDQMISSDYETKINIDRREFLENMNSALPFITEKEKKPVILNITENNINFRIKTAAGSVDNDMELSKDGKDILIAFNPVLVMDALKVIEDDNIDIYFLNAKAPCSIKNKEESYLYIVLPVNFNPEDI
ncbi:MAG: DNA polymerase III subunit beta [Catonella sp.]|uniref:DNA polymerase III subunit beta n=1 Tax=Catonella sp. TaxID=2382125 RepID=UPI003FA0C0A3